VPTSGREEDLEALEGVELTLLGLQERQVAAAVEPARLDHELGEAAAPAFERWDVGAELPFVVAGARQPLGRQQGEVRLDVPR
jgi:hypothetical protein